MFSLTFRNLTPDRKYTSKFFEKILAVAYQARPGYQVLPGNKDISISVNLVGEKKMRALNKKYRHKNKVTDILSFPMSEKNSQKPHTTYYILHTTDLGDLFICLSFAKKEAKSENISIERKLAWLTVHGFLHLAGYDHEKTAKDSKIMFKLEQKILHKLKVL